MAIFRTDPRLSPSMRGLGHRPARGFLGRLAEAVAYLAGRRAGTLR